MTISIAPSLRRKSGREHLDRGCEARLANGADCRREMSGTTVGEIVAIDRGHHDMSETECGDGLGNAGRLARVESTGLARPDIAEGASARAGVAHDHERGVALCPALADIGAAASSHTVTRRLRRNTARVASNSRAPGALTRIQGGFGRTGVSGSRAFSGWRGRALISA